MLYLLSINTNTGLDPNEVQAKLTSPSHSWYRISPTAWIICSIQPGQTSHWWTEYMSPLVKAHKGNMLVVRFDPNDRFGLMGKNFWDWFDLHSTDFY
jgi:hypothetical protein